MVKKIMSGDHYSCFKKLFLFILKKRFYLIALWFLFLCFSNVHFIVLPAVIRLITDTFISSLNHTQSITFIDCIYYALFFCASFFIPFSLRRCAQYCEIRLIPFLQKDFLDAYFYRLALWDLSFFQRNNSGSIIGGIEKILYEIVSLIQVDLYLVIPTFMLIIISIISISSVYLYAGLCFFLFTISLIIFYSINSYTIKKMLVQSAKDNESFMNYANDIITNIVTVKMTHQEGNECILLQQKLSQRHESFIAENKNVLKNNILSGFILCFFASLYCYVAVIACVQKIITIPDLSFLLSSFALLAGWVWFISERIIIIFIRLSNIKNLLSPLFEKPLVNDTDNAKNIIIAKGSITFDHVFFKYDNKKEYLFNDLNIQIPAGQKIALVGFSGCGKSSLVKLLLRINNIQKGIISIDGNDIKEMTQESLHKSINYVPQEPTLFNRSLLDNIVYGISEHVSFDAIVQVMKQVDLHEFIMQQEKNYYTVIGGSDGIQLSGGQRQRIAIARAFLNDKPIVIFDESSSQLDVKTEKKIIDALFNNCTTKTCIFIAHRLTSIVNFDRIIVFDNGKIINDGSHNELIHNHTSLYYQFWNMQKKQTSDLV